ncbi:ChaB family protein [Mesorhizobium sp. ORM8.1]
MDTVGSGNGCSAALPVRCSTRSGFVASCQTDRQPLDVRWRVGQSVPDMASVGLEVGTAMPYATERGSFTVRQGAPALHAQEIFRAAFTNAWDEYADRGEGREEVAHRLAWAAVKRLYRKQGRNWVPI